MCILLISTAHPKYPLVLLSNRDEYLNRPTSTAHFWSAPYDHILSPKDLARQEHGTWIGMSTKGRLAVLLNYREEKSDDNIGRLSRGALVKDFLTSEETSTEAWIDKLLKDAGPDGLSAVGGFSMMCGVLRPKDKSKPDDMSQPVESQRLEEFGVFSNRSSSTREGVSWIFGPRSEDYNASTDVSNPIIVDKTSSKLDRIMNCTFGISNSLFSSPWPKVHRGRYMLAEIVLNAISNETGEDEFVCQLFNLLSIDSISEMMDPEQEPAKAFDSLRHSIFIPVLNVGSQNTPKARADSEFPIASSELASGQQESYRFVPGKRYGTRTQTVILVSNDGIVKYIEKTLQNQEEKIIKDIETLETKVFEFKIEGW
ncbi:NRDE protein-domain-containing protein [Dipodascopsis uninucleata]